MQNYNFLQKIPTISNFIGLYVDFFNNWEGRGCKKRKFKKGDALMNYELRIMNNRTNESRIKFTWIMPSAAD